MGSPCQFGWQNMTETDKGRHCSQCDKTVVDFTVMTDEQVINYLLQHKNICGHFNKSQLGRTMAVHLQKPKTKKYWPAIAAMVVAGMFQITTVQAQSSTPSITTGSKITVYEGNKSNNDHYNDSVSVDGDTTITIKIKVIDSKTKKQIQGASIDITGIGNYTSDKLGYFKVSFCTKQLSKTIKIKAWANSYYSYSADILISEFIKSPTFNLEMWFDDPNMQVDGGEIGFFEEK